MNIRYDLKTINNMLEILGSLVVHKPDTLITADVVTNGCATPDIMTVVIDKCGIQDLKHVLKLGGIRDYAASILKNAKMVIMTYI